MSKNLEAYIRKRDYQRGTLPPRYPLPVNIGRVSLGTDYRGVWFIDDADQDDPVMVWCFDTWARQWFSY